MVGFRVGWWTCALFALVACDSVSDAEAVQVGCETRCTFRLECRFGTPAAVPACAAACPDTTAAVSDDCRLAYESLGRCVSERTGVGCAGLLGGFCGDDLDRVRVVCDGERLDGGMSDGAVVADMDAPPDMGGDGPDAGAATDMGEPADMACVPESCESMGAECGTVANSCGGAALDCPACEGGRTCEGNRCVSPCVPDQSVTLEASMAASTGAGDNGWTMADAALATADGSSASVSLRFSEPSQDLTLTDWGLDLPAGATVDGVRVSVIRAASGNSTDDAIQLVAGGSPLGAPKTAAGGWPATPASQSYGGATDRWGATLDRARVNAADFGVAVRARHVSASPSFTEVEHVTMTVHYSVGCP